MWLFSPYGDFSLHLRSLDSTHFLLRQLIHVCLSVSQLCVMLFLLSALHWSESCMTLAPTSLEKAQTYWSWSSLNPESTLSIFHCCLLSDTSHSSTNPWQLLPMDKSLPILFSLIIVSNFIWEIIKHISILVCFIASFDSQGNKHSVHLNTSKSNDVIIKYAMSHQSV